MCAEISRHCWECGRVVRSPFIRCAQCVKKLEGGRVAKGTPGFTRRVSRYEKEKLYEKEVDKGVKGKDLIQPYEEGKPNPDFIHHYGDSLYNQ